MKFGVFDHLTAATCQQDYYEASLLIEAYDQAGLRLSCCGTSLDAAWHGTVAQRVPGCRGAAHVTISFRPAGLCAAALPSDMLIEEICMLDQMSGGRLEIGFGRGASSTKPLFTDSILRRPNKSTRRD